MRNNFETHIKVNRGELCDLMLACSITACSCKTEKSKDRWMKLHDVLLTQLDELDKQLDEVKKENIYE